MAKKTYNTSKSEPRIPRPMNPFMIFRKGFQQEKVGTPEGETKLASKTAGRVWRGMPASEKIVYEELAKEEGRKHKQLYPNYRYQPRRKAKNATQEKVERGPRGPRRVSRAAPKPSGPPNNSIGTSRSSCRSGSSTFSAGHSFESSDFFYPHQAFRSQEHVHTLSFGAVQLGQAPRYEHNMRGGNESWVNAQHIPSTSSEATEQAYDGFATDAPVGAHDLGWQSAMNGTIAFEELYTAVQSKYLNSLSSGPSGYEVEFNPYFPVVDAAEHTQAITEDGNPHYTSYSYETGLPAGVNVSLEAVIESGDFGVYNINALNAGCSR